MRLRYLVGLALGLSTSAAAFADAGVTCPATLPEAGAPCAAPQLSCEFGGDLYGRCAGLAECGPQGKWRVELPPPGCQSNRAECPNAIEAGSRCALITVADDTCMPPTRACVCTQCTTRLGLSSQEWSCVAFPSQQRPLIGTPCVVEGETRYWSGCCTGVVIGRDEVCKNGLWQSTVNGGCICPPPHDSCATPSDGGLLVPDDASVGDAFFDDQGFGAAAASGCSCSVNSSSAPLGGIAFAGALGLLLRRRRARR